MKFCFYSYNLQIYEILSFGSFPFQGIDKTQAKTKTHEYL